MTAEAAVPLVTAPLGRTGHAVTRLGLGAAHIAGGQGGELSEDAAIATVHRALDVGITYLDTAPLYGDSERCIGLALRDHPRASELFIATKVGLQPGHLPDYSYSGVMRTIETSLERFGQPMLHLAQIHEIQDEHWEQVWRPDGAVAALLQAKEQHLIGHIGVTGSDPRAVARAIETEVFETVLIWKSFHLLGRTIAAATLHLAAERNMGVVVGTRLPGPSWPPARRPALCPARRRCSCTRTPRPRWSRACGQSRRCARVTGCLCAQRRCSSFARRPSEHHHPRRVQPGPRRRPARSRHNRHPGGLLGRACLLTGTPAPAAH